MLTKGIKYPYVKFFFDVIGILCAISVLAIIFVNGFTNSQSGNFSLGFEITGTHMIMMNILVLVTMICAIASTILRRVK